MATGYTTLNSVAVKNLASAVLFENIVQEILVVPNRGADFKYCQDLNANSVDVQRTKVVADGRVLGESTNGGFFDSAYGSLESEIFSIPLNIVASRVTKVPANAEIMNGNGLLLKSVLQNIPKQIARVVNCAYLASVLTDSLNAAISATSSEGTVSYAFDTGIYTAMTANTTAAAMAAFDTAVANLGNGDIAHGFDIFPLTNTQMFAKPAYLQQLKNNAGLFVNNPIAQQMLATGSFDAYDASYTPNVINGYYGEINGCVLTTVGSLFTTVEGWLGQMTLADGSKTGVSSGALTHLNAILVCGVAVGGGIDLRSEVKVVDAMGGQGWEVQPNARCGFSVFSPKGVQIIADNTGLTASNFVTYTGSGSTATQTKKLAILAPLNRS